ncbi:hypothetical protein D9M69_586010 [compost metagenome]
MAAVPKPIMLLPTPSLPPTCSSLGTGTLAAASCSAGFFAPLRAAILVGAAGAGAIALAMFARKTL